MAYVQMKDFGSDTTAEQKAAAIAAIAERSQKRHLSNTGASRGSLRVNMQASNAATIGKVSSRFRKPALNSKFEAQESRKVTKGRQKVKGGTIAPEGWYTLSQGADCVVGRDEHKNAKAITTQGIFKNGKNTGFKVR